MKKIIMIAVLVLMVTLSMASADKPRFKFKQGTVEDRQTGLVWLEKADCYRDIPYAWAEYAAATLKDGECGLSDRSVAGDWRMPEMEELVELGTNSGSWVNPFLLDDSYWAGIWEVWDSGTCCAWVVYMENGYVYATNFKGVKRFTAVRD